MHNVYTQFIASAQPTMNPQCVLQGEHWRIGILTESLLRFEWSDDGYFEDNITQMAVCRQFNDKPIPRYVVRNRDDGLLEIETPCLVVTYNRQRFTPEGLSVVVKGVSTSQHNTWHYADRAIGNLGGTARTLDEADGSIPLGEGVNSTDGWAVLDDSLSNIICLDDDAQSHHNTVFGCIVQPREHPEIDIYFFGYGHRYREAVQDFYRLSGPTPVLPRFALGNWWSRFYRYTQEDYLALMRRFKTEGLPFTTAVIDMDWHLVDDVDAKYGSGWTGYTWNTSLFPNHKQLLQSLHDEHMAVTLNVHPRDGIRAFEQPYEKAALAMGMNPADQHTVEFDLTNPTFIQTYLSMHHDLEREGVDFWWIDWQQGGVTRVPGLDPLWMLNHIHYLDASEHPRRALTFSRYAGPGSHRYPVGFSGDTVISWRSLAFQPEFTATASNIGYGWWSHDIGGHMLGDYDEQLSARWYQLGTFSSINRLHSSSSMFSGKEPWRFGLEARHSMMRSLRLRHELIPYLYTMNYRAADEGLPLIEPMYWYAPDIGEAYQVKTQYWFGTELIVSPIVEPNDEILQLGKARVWFPKGNWFDYQTGRHYESQPDEGMMMQVWRPLDHIPVFAKAGAIVPTQILEQGHDLNTVDNPQAMQIIIFPGADGKFVLREDSGIPHVGVATTVCSLQWRTYEGNSVIAVDAAQGEITSLPSQRNWQIVIRGVAPVAREDMQLYIDHAAVDIDEIQLTYHASTMSVVVQCPEISVGQRIELVVRNGIQIGQNPVQQDIIDVLQRARMKYRSKDLALQMLMNSGVQGLMGLASLQMSSPDTDGMFTTDMPESVVQACQEIMLRSVKSSV